MSTSDAPAKPETRTAAAAAHEPAPVATSGDMQIERLVNVAFQRTKERFLSFFVTTLIVYGMFILAFIGIALIVALHFFIYAVTSSVAVTATVGTIVGLIAIVGLFYLNAWSSLAMFQVMIGDTGKTAIEVLKEVRPKVWSYTWLISIMPLFFLGLLPISIFTLFILYVVWGIWAAFTSFIFLEQGHKGMDNVWVSKAMVQQNFWGIFGRIALVNLAVIVLTGAIAGLGGESGWANFLSIVVSFVTTPFIIAYTYEIYKATPVVKTAERPTVWIAISVIGWILMLFLLFYSVSNAAGNFPGFVEGFQEGFMEGLEEEMKTGTM
jgi:hypothetical protein